MKIRLILCAFAVLCTCLQAQNGPEIWLLPYAEMGFSRATMAGNSRLRDDFIFPKVTQGFDQSYRAGLRAEFLFSHGLGVYTELCYRSYMLDGSVAYPFTEQLSMSIRHRRSHFATISGILHHIPEAFGLVSIRYGFGLQTNVLPERVALFQSADPGPIGSDRAMAVEITARRRVSPGFQSFISLYAPAGPRSRFGVTACINWLNPLMYTLLYYPNGLGVRAASESRMNVAHYTLGMEYGFLLSPPVSPSQSAGRGTKALPAARSAGRVHTK
ncbi:MAG: hypothetical protein EAZ89_05605 [Bacteroidetes bacterium]|nr:MAG: hypothetical protein EAZ89_05605 [Bacteroidota bacterium]